MKIFDHGKTSDYEHTNNYKNTKVQKIKFIFKGKGLRFKFMF